MGLPIIRIIKKEISKQQFSVHRKHLQASTAVVDRVSFSMLFTAGAALLRPGPSTYVWMHPLMAESVYRFVVLPINRITKKEISKQQFSVHRKHLQASTAVVDGVSFSMV